MTLTELNNEIEYHILKRDLPIDEERIPHVTALVFESNYIEIYYKYGIATLYVVLEVLENHEIYEQCAVIKQTIDNINKLEKKKYPTTYEET